MKKNILFVNDEREVGGVSSVLTNILTEIDLDKYNIDLFIFQNNGIMFDNLDKRINIIYGDNGFSGIDTSFKSNIVEHHYYLAFKKLIFVILAKLNLIKYFFRRKRKKILGNKKYDVEIAFKTGYPTLFTSSGNSKRKITWIHSDLSRDDDMKRYSNSFKKNLENIDVVVNLNDKLKEGFISLYGNKDKCVVINNLLNYKNVLNLSKEDCEIKFDKSKKNLITVGRLHFNKGYLRLIDALAKVKNEYNNFHLYMIGDGPEKDKIVESIEKNNLEDYITLVGYSSNPFKYLKNADLFICSSITEAYPMVFLESLVLGVPIFTLDVASANDILQNGKYGYIYDNNDESLYNGLVEVLKNKKLKEVKDYSYKKINSGIMKKIYQLLDGE